jgi:hypothetical protein
MFRVEAKDKDTREKQTYISADRVFLSDFLLGSLFDLDDGSNKFHCNVCHMSQDSILQNYLCENLTLNKTLPFLVHPHSISSFSSQLLVCVVN